MKSFAVIAAVAGLAAAHDGWASASGSWGKPVYVTDVVTAYTTYCPSATKITHGASTYTVTEATTLTISDCPCTITRPVSSTAVVATPVPSKSAVGSVAPPPVSAGPSASAASSYYASVKPSASASGSAPSTTYTGAASKAQVAGGMLAALGLVAAAL